MASSWGVKWHNRYLKEGIAGLQTRPRSGRPPRISSEIMKIIKKSKKDGLPDGRGPSRYHSQRFRHRVPDRVYRNLRACAAAGLGIHQKGSSWKARQEGQQAEDRLVQKKAGAAHREEEGRGLHGMRAGRGDMRGRRAAPGRAYTRPRGSAASTRTRDRIPRGSGTFR